MATQNEKIKISLQADVSQTLTQLIKVRNELKEMSKNTTLNLNSAELNKFIKQIDQYRNAIKQSTSIGSDDTLNLNQLKSFEKGIGTTFNDLVNNIDNYYKKAGKAVDVTTDTEKSLTKLEAPAKRAATAIDKLGVSLTNSLRYNVVNNFVDAFLSKGGEVIDLLSQVDEKMTQIQIVSGKASDALQGVQQDALIGAKELSSTTTDVLSAYETYYQQGLSSNEAKSRAEATVMAANVSNQSVGTTAEQVTAVLNGFNISASNTIEVLGKMANIGAKTATDFSEIAKAMQKVASASDVAGLSLDDTLAAMATISSVTREAPETIGTSLNAILGRIGNLKIDEEYTSAIEEMYKDTKSGLTLFDEQTGLLKDASVILSELADKWHLLDINQQRAITSQLAGTRQANRLLALMENWDMFEQYQEYAADSGNALEEQNDIYLNSVEAAQNRMKTEWDEFWLNLFDDDMLKGWYDFLANLIDTFDNATQSAGGLLSIIRTITGLLSKTLGRQLGNYVGAKAQANYLRGAVKTNESEEAFNATQNRVNKGLNQLGLGNLELLNEYQRQINLTDEQAKSYEKLSEKLIKITNETLKYKEVLESEVFKNIDYSSSFYDKETGQTKTETNKLSTATDFVNYYNNIVKNTTGLAAQFEGDERNPLIDSIKASLQKADVSKVKSKYYGELDSGLIDQYYRNFESLKQILTDFSEKGNETLNNIIKTTKRQIEVVGRNEQEIAKEYSDIYDQRTKNLTLKQSAAEIVNKQKNKETLTEKEQIVADRYTQSQEVLNAKRQVQITLLDIIKSGFNSANLKLDGEVNEEQFFNTLIDMINNGFKRMESEAMPGGLSLAKQSELELEAGNIMPGLQKEASTLKTKMEAIFSGAKANSLTQGIFKWAQFAGSAFSGLTQLMDENLSTQEKFSVGLNSIGAALSGFPGVVGAVGFAVSALSPIFLEVFDLGKDEAEKLEEQMNSLTKATESLTLNLKEQKSELSNINDAYIQLVKQYEEQPFNYEDLTEEQKQSYEQVADYVSKYAPELVKYYNAEGMAVIDLTDKYNSLANTKKSYLQNQINLNEVQTYSAIKDNTGENAELIIKNYGSQLELVEKYNKEIAEYQQKSLRTNKDYSEKIGQLQEELSKAKDAVSGIGEAWDTNVTQPLTRGNYVFHSLSSELQNSVLNMSSYQTYLQSDFGLSTDVFAVRIESFINTLGGLSEETIQKFQDMDASVRNAIFSITNNMSLSSTQLIDYLNNITAESFISGEFLDEYNKIIEDSKNERISELEKQKADLYEQREGLENTRTTTRQNRIDSIRGYSSIDGEENGSEVEYEVDFSGVEKEIEQNVNSLNNQIEAIQDETELMRSQWIDSLREMASTSDEAYNQIAQSYNDMMEQLETVPENSEEYDDMLERAQSMYAVLQGSNTEYYNNWKALNAETLNDIMETYGINADNYKTYNEYMTALDEQKSKLKLLYEIAATEGIQGVEKALFENKKENMLQELSAQGRTEEAALLLATEGSKQKIVISSIETKNKLLMLKEQLLAAQKEGQEEVALSGQQVQLLISHQGNLTKQMRQNMINAFGAETVNGALGKAGPISTKASFNTNLKATLSVVDDAIARIEQFQSSIAGELGSVYNDALTSIQGISDLEKYIAGLQYNTTDFGKYDVTFKKPSTPSVPNNVASVGGGDKDKDKGSSKEVEDLKLELDILRPYIIAIEELEHELDILQEKKEQVWGAQYIEYMEQELDLNKKLLAANEGKLQAAKEYANVLKIQLQAQGAMFTDYGAISNYNELLTNKQNWTNSLSGDAKEDAKKSVEEFKDLMDKYEDYALNTVRDIEKEILDVKNNIADIAQEQIEYIVEIVVEAKDNKNDLLDFLTEVQKYKKGEVSFSIDISGNADKILNSLDSLKEIEEKTSVDNLIDKVLNSEELKGMTDKQLEIIQNRIEELQDLGSELIKFEEAFTEAFANAFDEALDLLDDQISKYDNVLDQYNYILDLADKINNKDLDFNNQTYDKIADIYRNNLEASKQLAEDIKASRDQFEVGTEDWRVANEKYLEAQAQVIEQEKALTDALENKFDSTVSIGREQIENALFNGGTLEDAERQLEKLNELRDKYLSKEQKIYSLDKMKYNIMQDMKEYEYSPEAQNELENWMNKELDYLNNKKDLTQDDLDLAEKQYAVLKARIDMENAYNNKKYIATLQRNADGTYGYMYIQDTSQYEAASQNYRDAVDDLYNYSLERNEALQEENIKLKQEALEEYDRIVAQLKVGMITSEEATKLLQETFNQLQENLKNNAAEQEQISQNAISTTQLQILMNELMNTESMDRIQDISSETQQIINDNLTAAGMDYDDFVNSKLYQELNREDMFTADITDEWNKLDDLINNDMDSIANDFNFENEDSMISKIVNSINDAYKEFNDVVNDAFQNAIDRQEDLMNTTKDMNTQMEELNNKLADEINKVTELKNKYNDLRQNVTQALDQITNSLNKLMDAKNRVENAANSGQSGSGSGGSGGSSGGSGGSGGGAPVLNRGSAIRVKPGRRWYYDSRGTNPSGPTDPYANRTLYIVNTSSNAYPYAVGTSTNISSALGWLKKEDIQGYDTGGYTGDWNSKEGRLALLHEKEIVLNKDDTKNFLKGIELSNELIRDNIKNYRIDNNNEQKTVNYNEFSIDFPSATDSNEIRKAIKSLPQIASQYIGRKK